MISQDKLIFVGLISSARGVKGDVVVKSFTNPISNIGKLPIVNKQSESLKLTIIKQNTKNELICRVDKITNRTDAEKLKGCKLFCLRSTFPPPAEEEFYIEDLKGLMVVNNNLQHIGIIKNVCNFGGGDLIEVEFIEGYLRLFPFTKEFFPKLTNEYAVLDLIR